MLKLILWLLEKDFSQMHCNMLWELGYTYCVASGRITFLSIQPVYYYFVKFVLLTKGAFNTIFLGNEDSRNFFINSPVANIASVPVLKGVLNNLILISRDAELPVDTYVVNG